MRNFDDQLQSLQEQIVRQRKLQSAAESLASQEAALQARVRELDLIRASEQADVDRLEGRTLAAFFYAVIGKREDRLSREQQEAYAAAVKFDAAARELESVAFDLEQTREELRSLQGCEARYRQVLEQKAAEIKASGSPDAARILELESRLSRETADLKEIREAIQAGRAALSTADSILGSLDSAEGWGTWDLLGGGLIADAVKHSHLDSAQADVEQLQLQLRRFRTELADTRIYADLQVNVDGFLLFADYFFDGLFADWAVLDHIGRAKEQVDGVRRQIRDTLDRLEGSAGELEAHSRDIRAGLDRLIASAQTGPA